MVDSSHLCPHDISHRGNGFSIISICEALRGNKLLVGQDWKFVVRLHLHNYYLDVILQGSMNNPGRCFY